MSFDVAPKTFSVNAPTMTIHGRKVHVVADGAALCNKSYVPGLACTWRAEQPAGTEWLADLFTLCSRCEAKHAHLASQAEPADDECVDCGSRNLVRCACLASQRSTA